MKYHWHFHLWSDNYKQISINIDEFDQKALKLLMTPFDVLTNES